LKPEVGLVDVLTLVHIVVEEHSAVVSPLRPSLQQKPEDSSLFRQNLYPTPYDAEFRQSLIVVEVAA